MIGSEEALRHILAVCRPLATEMVPLALTLDRVLAHDVVATDDLPPFDNSAMDGFALATHGVELQVGREFVVSGLQAAGDAMTDASQACEIMTGACLPTGLDAVVPVEQVSVLARDVDGRPQRIRLCATVGHRAHVRGRGEDVARDQLVLSAGQRVTPASRMLLAAIGVAETSMRPQVPAALLNTGRELVDEPRQPLASGQIRNCNGPYLTDRLREAGCCVVHQQTVGDDAQAFAAALDCGLAAGARVILSTGAVSMGRYDFVPDALHALGAEIVFHEIAMRPGKPLLFAILPGGELYFGLPGNPASAAVGMRFFVEPAVRALLGLPCERPLRLPLVEGVKKKPGFRFLLKARVEFNPQSDLQVRVLTGQESFRIRPMLDANAWVSLDDGAEQLSAGTMVDVYGLDARGVRLSAMEVASGN